MHMEARPCLKNSPHSTDATVKYTYDGRGNQISETNETNGTNSITTTCTYAVTGEMTGLEVSSRGTVTYTQENKYNHEGIRISRTEGCMTRRYYYDNGIVAYTKDGTSVSSSNVLSADGNVLGTYRNSDYYTYTKDTQNSTENIIKSDGTLAAAYTYTDFGETSELTGSNFDNEICYTGAVYDAESGLYYMNARYYNPENGRFISQDMYRGELDEVDQWHLYAYCANNPINYVDPTGHFLLEIPFEVGVVLSLVAIITSSYVIAKINSEQNSFLDVEYNFKNRKKNHYKVKLQVHKPSGYEGKTGVSAMKARWKDERKKKGKKGSKSEVLKRFVKNHKWRYHGHIRIIKNGVNIKTIDL